MRPALRALKGGAGGNLEDRIAALASCLGVPIESRKLSALPDEQFTRAAQPRHAGYHASTRVVLSRLSVPMW